MKEIKAYIRPHRLDEVAFELRKHPAVSGLSCLPVQGFGETTPDEHSMVDFNHYQRIELFCRNEDVSDIVKIISRFAHEGIHGDGNILVCHVDQVIRISTGETV